MQKATLDSVSQWLSSTMVDEATKEVIRRYQDDERNDCFHRNLSFGTGGLRGVLGAGTNRMNIYTVRKATQGLANHLNATGLPKRVAIARDSRNQSDAFAVAAAEVLAAAGIQALLYQRIEPTPALSFAVRDQQCGAGICITASHNPAKYNGYKVYGADGCQITLDAAEQIQSCIEALDLFADVHFMPFEQALAVGLARYVGEDVLDRYLAAVKAQSLQASEGMPVLSVVYTPLNGAGLECVRRILSDIGVTSVHIVKEQEVPNGNFPTCPFPNPEMEEALSLGLRDCQRHQPDLLLATDPDCDRVGIAVRDRGAYVRLTGNEVGVLLLDYLCRARLEVGLITQRPVAVTTVVSTAMADPVAAKYGVELRRTLTGFKFIGEQIGLLEAAAEENRFIFGFEESYGYLSGGYVRDKDGVNASMLICQMARWYRQQNLTLVDAMNQLYAEFGFYVDNLRSYTFEGSTGMLKIQQLMGKLRLWPPTAVGGIAVSRTIDYQTDDCDLPKTDMLSIILEDGCKLMIRPSGTEPKLKVYFFSYAPSRARAEETMLIMRSWMDQQMQ